MENIMENENLVTEQKVVEQAVEQSAEQVAENVEVTTEETPKMYSEAEFNAKLDELLGKKLARRENKIRKEYEKKYGDLEGVLRAGTGKENVEDITATFKDFYGKKGIQIPEKPRYSARDIEVLAKAEAEDIIRCGYDEVVEEVDRLAKLGADNMTAREKSVFVALANYRQNAERSRDLSKLGVTEDVYNSEKFQTFASKFNLNVPVSEIYEIYSQNRPKKQVRTMGSMKSQSEPAVKDYYSPEEIERLTMKDLDDPKVWDAVRRSMTGKA